MLRVAIPTHARLIARETTDNFFRLFSKVPREGQAAV